MEESGIARVDISTFMGLNATILVRQLSDFETENSAPAMLFKDLPISIRSALWDWVNGD